MDVTDKDEMVGGDIFSKMIKFLIKSQKYQKIVKSQRFKTNLLSPNASNLLLKKNVFYKNKYKIYNNELLTIVKMLKSDGIILKATNMRSLS